MYFPAVLPVSHASTFHHLISFIIKKIIFRLLPVLGHLFLQLLLWMDFFLAVPDYYHHPIFLDDAVSFDIRILFLSGVTSTVSSTASCRQKISGSFICSRLPFPDFESSFSAFFRSRSEQILIFRLSRLWRYLYTTITKIFFSQTIPGHLLRPFIFALNFSGYRSSPPGTTFLSVLIQFGVL